MGISQKFEIDFYRYKGKKWRKLYGIKYLFSDHSILFLYLLRSLQASNNKNILFRIFLNHMKKKYGLEISYKTKIGSGFYIGHAYNITINPNTIIGNNVNIHKGVTIGQENRGNRKGTPVIDDMVWIGVNSTIVGKINIGRNVLIAPNSYVNFDVPENSIVIGNPAKVIKKENATEGYINRVII